MDSVVSETEFISIAFTFKIHIGRQTSVNFPGGILQKPPLKTFSFTSHQCLILNVMILKFAPILKKLVL